MLRSPAASLLHQPLRPLLRQRQAAPAEAMGAEAEAGRGTHGPAERGNLRKPQRGRCVPAATTARGVTPRRKSPMILCSWVPLPSHPPARGAGISDGNKPWGDSAPGPLPRTVPLLISCPVGAESCPAPRAEQGFQGPWGQRSAGMVLGPGARSPSQATSWCPGCSCTPAGPAAGRQSPTGRPRARRTGSLYPPACSQSGCWPGASCARHQSEEPR